MDNHAQISGAIASLKTVDDETKQKLDFDNDCYVIMKNKHIEDDDYKNDLMKNLIKIKEGDKYTIYAEP